ncbi:MAG: crosslink repair DNA glycosylase YcaQ family protein [Kiloniellales bacterium]|nr:crosslink repair DNA glycosylase YcaQ family protein [Kiloniellales bacterium]
MTPSSAALPVIPNPAARRLLLEAQGLTADPARKQDGAGLLRMIEDLGYVQVDSINTVERAHHHILFSRNQTYRQPQLARLLEGEAALFENWTHDAAIIPSRFYPFWRQRFEREKARLAERWRKFRRVGFEGYFEAVLERIAREGPLMARDFGEDGKKNSGGWWDWHPEKTALEYLWRTGALAVARREAFQKVYDLPERVIPERHRGPRPDHEAFVDWKCRSALERLRFATWGELAAFWGTLTPAEAKAWCQRELGRSILQVAVEPADGGKPRSAFAPIDLLDRLATLPEPPPRIRALNPFDPVIRDRARLERLFGFHYRIEVFVPAAKRRYGYYVFPLLEGARLIGRLDMKHDRQADGALRVTGLWLEPGIKMTRGRTDRLTAELLRIRRFVGAEILDFDPARLNGPVAP